MTELTVEHKKIWLLGLLFNCPVGTEKDNCKINGMRNLPYKEREKKVFKMEESELNELIEHHKCCMKDR